VQNERGDSLLLHQLVGHLAESGLLSSIDPFVVNNGGLELARQRKGEPPDEPTRAAIRSLIDVQEQMSEVRPLTFVAGRIDVHLLSNLADIVLAFIDGEGCA